MTENEKSSATAMSDDEIIKALECCTNKEKRYCRDCPLKAELPCVNLLATEAFDLINRLQADKEALIAGQETLQKALAEKTEESETQSQNFKVLVSDHKTLQHSFDNLKGLYEAEKAKVEKTKEMFILWVDDICFKSKTKNGLSPETKQAILDDFMKNSEQ